MSKIKQVKSVTPNFIQFFWTNMANIRNYQIQGDYSTALKLLATFVAYLPDDMKKKFDPIADQVIHSMDHIASGKMPEHKAILDPFIRQIAQARLLNTYAYEKLNEFIRALTSELTDRGYLEAVSHVRRGTDGTKF